MLLTLTFLFVTITPPLVSHFRHPALAMLFMSAAVGYGCFAVGIKVNAFPTDLSFGLPEHGANFALYSLGHSLSLMQIVNVMVFCGAVIWLQERLGAMYFPSLTKLSFWLLHLGQATSIGSFLALTILPSPRRYIDHPVAIDSFLMAQTASFYLSCMAALSLLGLVMLSCMRHRCKRASG
ncbi:hypothetical protein KMP13_12765 [Epibacterium ulvae]|uniref:hypothetical protein n=1 Tax=Epibacterium ulvae TaxID=1156985 RepID=UPI001BFC33C7|nr:hypothetical protein [Epibacterium ulvae]MBT8154742.1 hypothetical protein [Epibacterium ulvae]